MWETGKVDSPFMVLGSSIFYQNFSQLNRCLVNEIGYMETVWQSIVLVYVDNKNITQTYAYNKNNI